MINDAEILRVFWGFCIVVFSFILAETIYYEIKERKQNSSNRKRGKKNL
jgi:hypothetical protein